ncbi:MAG: autotransporter-associated beta strand repeat-containing protein, partial [Rhodobacteraceae bacterium]|nr:autotransporter-associated beta strand repeat-containing protein [Paracoccaceae bacterium]
MCRFVINLAQIFDIWPTPLRGPEPIGEIDMAPHNPARIFTASGPWFLAATPRPRHRRRMGAMLLGTTALAMALGLGLGLATGGPAMAQVSTWTGGMDNTWVDDDNWTGGGVGPNDNTPDGATASAVFDDAGLAATITLGGGPFTVNQLQLVDGFTLSTGTLNLGGTTPQITYTAASGQSRLASTLSVVLNAGTTADIAAGGTLIVDSVVSGAGALAKTGDGTLVLTGVNTYAGGSTLGAGTLRLGAFGGTPATLGTGALLLDGGVFEVTDGAAGATTFTVTNDITVAGTATVRAPGDDVLVLGDGASTFTRNAGSALTLSSGAGGRV